MSYRQNCLSRTIFVCNTTK